MVVFIVTGFTKDIQSGSDQNLRVQNRQGGVVKLPLYWCLQTKRPITLCGGSRASFYHTTSGKGPNVLVMCTLWQDATWGTRIRLFVTVRFWTQTRNANRSPIIIRASALWADIAHECILVQFELVGLIIWRLLEFLRANTIRARKPTGRLSDQFAFPFALEWVAARPLIKL